MEKIKYIFVPKSGEQGFSVLEALIAGVFVLMAGLFVSDIIDIVGKSTSKNRVLRGMAALETAVFYSLEQGEGLSDDEINNYLVKGGVAMVDSPISFSYFGAPLLSTVRPQHFNADGSYCDRGPDRCSIEVSFSLTEFQGLSRVEGNYEVGMPLYLARYQITALPSAIEAGARVTPITRQLVLNPELYSSGITEPCPVDPAEPPNLLRFVRQINNDGTVECLGLDPSPCPDGSVATRVVAARDSFGALVPNYFRLGCRSLKRYSCDLSEYTPNAGSSAQRLKDFFKSVLPPRTPEQDKLDLSYLSKFYGLRAFDPKYLITGPSMGIPVESTPSCRFIGLPSARSRTVYSSVAEARADLAANIPELGDEELDALAQSIFDSSNNSCPSLSLPSGRQIKLYKFDTTTKQCLFNFSDSEDPNLFQEYAAGVPL